MKIKTRLAIAFLTVTMVPITLIWVAVWGLSNYQMDAFRKTHGLTKQIDLLGGNSLQIFNRLTKTAQEEIRASLQTHPDDFEDAAYLAEINDDLVRKYTYLIVRRDDEIIYDEDLKQQDDKSIYGDLLGYREVENEIEGGIYLDGDTQHLVKQVNFRYSDGSSGSVLIVSGMDDYVPEIKPIIWKMLFTGVLILLMAGILLTTWVYKSTLKPLGMLQKVTDEIKNGDLDFVLEVEEKDEVGQICQDFEEMRIRLKEPTEERIQYDEENKKLIGNTSCDLKAPITTTKGYVEGIMDRMASSPEKLDKYIRTIYSKANDMDRLIDELTFYSRIDTNKILYISAKIDVTSYFRDCVEEVGLDMEFQDIGLGCFNYVDEDVMVIADAEQIRRVTNNIISNSVKYLDKKRGIISIRIRDAGDFIQVEIEDSGKGIAAKDLPNIFDKSYRTDSSRNSTKGGSGIGLSIVRKIIEDHDGRIRATSREGIGTGIHFVLRKYREVMRE